MRNAGLEEAQAGINIAGRNINNLRYADDTTLMAESEEELKSFLMKVKLLSHVRLLAIPWTAAHQASPSMGFSRQVLFPGKSTGVGCHCLPLVTLIFLKRSLVFPILLFSSIFLHGTQTGSK